MMNSPLLVRNHFAFCRLSISSITGFHGNWRSDLDRYKRTNYILWQTVNQLILLIKISQIITRRLDELNLCKLWKAVRNWCYHVVVVCQDNIIHPVNHHSPFPIPQNSDKGCRWAKAPATETKAKPSTTNVNQTANQMHHRVECSSQALAYAHSV